jgi:hypothetical protein
MLIPTIVVNGQTVVRHPTTYDPNAPDAKPGDTHILVPVETWNRLQDKSESGYWVVRRNYFDGTVLYLGKDDWFEPRDKATLYPSQKAAEQAIRAFRNRFPQTVADITPTQE